MTMTKKSTQLFDTGYAMAEFSSGSISSQDLSPIGTVLVDEQAGARLCGFALAFYRLAKASTFVFNAKSSNCISEVSCSLLSFTLLLLKSVTNLIKRWEILTHEWELPLFTDSILLSTPYLACKQLVVTYYQHGSNFGVPSNPSFRVRWFSSLGKVYSRRATDSVNCANYSVSFVMKYCPTSTVVRNPASVQNLITWFCCDSLSTRSWYSCNRSSCAGSSVEGVGVVINELVGTNNGSICPTKTCLPSLTWQDLYSSHKSDCSVDTELINWTNCA